MGMQSQTVTEFRFRVLARVNSGDTIERAIDGALREGGPLRAVRVSSAQARGAAKKYAYWGATRYHVRIARAGHITCVPIERATSDRRSTAGAERDADALAVAEGRIWAPGLGKVSARAVARLAGVAS